MSPAGTPHLLAVVGSVTAPGRLRGAIAEGVRRTPDDVRADLVDLAEVELPFADGRALDAMGGDAKLVVDRIARSDAVLLGTPVYRGSLTGALKNLLDLTPVEALEGKPVGIVAMGATTHHYLGAERHLRDVLAFFGAHVAPVAGYLTSADFDAGVASPRALDMLDGLIAGLVGLSRTLDGSTRLGPRPLAARA